MTRDELVDILREALDEGPLPELAPKWEGGTVVLNPGILSVRRSGDHSPDMIHRPARASKSVSFMIRRTSIASSCPKEKHRGEGVTGGGTAAERRNILKNRAFLVQWEDEVRRAFRKSAPPLDESGGVTSSVTPSELAWRQHGWKEKAMKKSCYNCTWGVITLIAECTCQVGDEYLHSGGFCPDELLCDRWEYSASSEEANSIDWSKAIGIDVD